MVAGRCMSCLTHMMQQPQTRAGLDQQDVHGRTGVMLCILEDRFSEAQMLLTHGARADIQRPRDAVTALHLVCARMMCSAQPDGVVRMVETLIEHKANPSAVLTRTGETSLHILAKTAVVGTQIEAKEKWVCDAITLCLRAGGEPKAHDKRGRTAYDLALKRQEQSEASWARVQLLRLPAPQRSVRFITVVQHDTKESAPTEAEKPPLTTEQERAIREAYRIIRAPRRPSVSA